VPAHERGPLREWSLAILGALEPVLTAEQFTSGSAAVDDFKHYLHGLVERRLREESHDESEILSKLIAATDLAPTLSLPRKRGREREGADDKLSELELLHNCIFILNAGHETTTNLIGNGVDLLIRNPDAMRDLRANPELIETAVEEFLRVESSNQLGNRRAALDTALGGVAMPRGTFIHIGIGAANRDPAQFADPESFDVGRTPNRHLAFSQGIHFCLGAPLARLELQEAIAALIRRTRTIDSDDAAAAWRENVRMRGLRSLRVTLAPA
jgi:cytochrome P450